MSWCKNVFYTRYKTLLTEKKLCNYDQDFKKASVAIIWYSWIRLKHYKKTYLAPIVKWHVAWKQDLARPQFSYENLSHHTLHYYAITKKPRRVFLLNKESWSSWGLSLIGFSLSFKVIGTPMFHSGPLNGPCWVLSNRFLSWSSMLFFWQAVILLSKCAATFFIKNICSVLHYIFKKLSHLTISFKSMVKNWPAFCGIFNEWH